MSFLRRGSPPFIPNHLTPNFFISSTSFRASCVFSSLGAGPPEASTLQYLQRALQAPVDLQEVMSNGPLSAKQNSPSYLPWKFRLLVRPKKIMWVACPLLYCFSNDGSEHKPWLPIFSQNMFNNARIKREYRIQHFFVYFRKVYSATISTSNSIC
jgi:hypothetical protein